MARVIICNKCGKTLNEYDEEPCLSLYNVVGYGSIYDGERIELDLCSECMDKLIESCAISPIPNNCYPSESED